MPISSLFAQRSQQLELLDNDHIPAADLARNLYELGVINRWLGGYVATLKGLEQLITHHQSATYHVADIGCGGGDTLLQMARWARKKKLQIRFTGVDYKPEAITFAQETCKDYPEISFVCSDYRTAVFDSPPDIFTSALFCHHLPDTDLVSFIGFMQKKARIGFIINDLHRNFLAYYSIKWLTQLFSGSYLVKNDAPLSVLRGFSRAEWQKYLSQANAPSAKIAWIWAFRWLIVGTKK